MKTYNGVVRVGEAGVTLNAGGVEVRLEGDREQFLPLDGLTATLTGEQEGDTIRNAAPAPRPEHAPAADGDAAPLDPAVAAIKSKGETLRKTPGVFGVMPGFRTSGGEQTDEPAIIVLTRPGEEVGKIEPEIGGIRVETRPATALELQEGVAPLSAWEGVLPEAAPQIAYTPPDGVALEDAWVRNITCHVGPDSGWSTLKQFLENTEGKLTVAMYEFYADHILDSMARLGQDPDLSLNMILQVSGNDADVEGRMKDAWKQRLSFTPASVSGPQRVFNNSYHTKVAVRDSSAFWLSSGNWNPTSQPLITPGSEQTLYSKGNREWHVVIEDETLAQMFEKFIEHDIEQARAAGEPESAPVMPDLLIPESALAEPEAAVAQDHPFVARTFPTTGNAVRVKPLMSPDNYAPEILKLIRNAERSLYLQFSYIRQPSSETFDEIISAISDKMREGLDVRVLVGVNQKEEHSNILLGRRRWKRSMFRRQTSKLHNKGILIDDKIAVVGSNNWSSDGTQYNRDASLVFYSRPIAQYYTEVFLFDWDNLSKPIGSAPEVTPVLAPETGPTPAGMVRIPWRAWFDE
jgi:phosphatidylserine/phosphatidylglycerophosphate/cardiolipin synthase-like enzyme